MNFDDDSVVVIMAAAVFFGIALLVVFGLLWLGQPAQPAA